MDIVTKKQLNILIHLAEADKHFAKVERDMIFRIAKARNFPDEVVNNLIRNPEPIETLGALSNDQKFEYLMACIELMFADQKVLESEVTFCRSIAIKLGFKRTVVDFMAKNFSRVSSEELKNPVLEDFMLT